MSDHPQGPSRSRLVVECVGGADADETLVAHEDTYSESVPVITIGMGNSEGNYVDRFRWLDHEAARSP